MKKIISLLLVTTLFFSLFLVSCKKKDPPEFYLTSEIPSETREKAEKTLSAFMQAFEEDDARRALSLLSGDAGFTEENISAFFSELAKNAEAPFVPYDTYYMKDLEVTNALIRVKKAISAKNYIELTAASEEIYCAIYVSEGETNSFMMSLILTRDGDNFKIAEINPSSFKFHKADAPALYEKTLSLYNEAKIIPAYITSCMLANVFRPGGYYRYEKDIEMEDICYKLYAEVQKDFPLPLELEGTNSSRIHRIGITTDAAHGVIPVVHFETKTPISDTTALREECIRVLSSLENLSPGTSEISEYVCFNATNDEITDSEAPVTSEKIVLKIR